MENSVRDACSGEDAAVAAGGGSDAGNNGHWK